MPAIALPFTPAEYDRRLALVRKEMANRGLDALFVTDPSNQAWLTGYDGWSFYVHQGVIILQDADPIWWGRNQDTNGALRTVWMEADRVIGYEDGFVQNPDRHPMQNLSTILGSVGVHTGRIGVEMDNYYYSAKAHASLGYNLPEALLVDATGLVNWQRTVKSEPELAFMRKAAQISEKIVDGLLERVEPGVPKNEIVAEIYRDAIRGVDGAWGDYPAIVPLLPSGSDAAAPHLTWDGRPFLTGEATFFEISGCYRRYHAPFCRTLFLGTPPDFLKRAEAALVEGLEAGLDMARAGNRACDVANALAAPLERAGIERGARCGYRSEDETVLEPNMPFHFMPGLWMQDWGIEITESIRIREDGPAETFCNRPRQMFVK